MPSPDSRPTVEAPDDDPYLWLEEIDGERALGWVEAQNAATLARFGDARFAADRDTLAAIYDRPDNIPVIARRGTRVFNFWKDAVHPRGLWRTTTLDSYRSEAARVGHPARPRRAGGKGGRGLDVERRHDDPRHPRPRHRKAVARRR